MEPTKINLKNLIANNDGELINTKLTLDDYRKLSRKPTTLVTGMKAY